MQGVSKVLVHTEADDEVSHFQPQLLHAAAVLTINFGTSCMPTLNSTKGKYIVIYYYRIHEIYT